MPPFKKIVLELKYFVPAVCKDKQLRFAHQAWCIFVAEHGHKGLVLNPVPIGAEDDSVVPVGHDDDDAHLGPVMILVLREVTNGLFK